MSQTRTVLVTGANGFVGRNLCQALVEAGHAVKGLVRPGSERRFLSGLKGLALISGDITVPEHWPQALEGVEAVFHAAAKVSDWGPRAEFQAANVEGVRNVVEAARERGVRRVVVLSTVSVYGFPGQKNVDETFPLRPRPSDPYAATKAQGERLALSFNGQGVEVTALRAGGIYGPHDQTTSLKMIPFLLKGRFCHVDHGRRVMAPLYIDNLIQALNLAAWSPAAPGQVYNIVDQGEVTWQEYIAWMCQELGCPLSRLSAPGWLAWPAAGAVEFGARLVGLKDPPPITRYRVRAVMRDSHYSIQKARRELGYEPQVSTREGIRRTIRWYREWEREGGGISAGT